MWPLNGQISNKSEIASRTIRDDSSSSSPAFLHTYAFYTSQIIITFSPTEQNDFTSYQPYHIYFFVDKNYYQMLRVKLVLFHKLIYFTINSFLFVPLALIVEFITKSGHEPYRGQVPKERGHFANPPPECKRSALWGVLSVMDFPMRQVLPAKW